MELMTIDALLTLVPQRTASGLRAWAEAGLLAAEHVALHNEPMWRALPQVLPEAGWMVESSSHQMVALPQLAPLLQLDGTLAVLLDRRGGLALPERAAQLLDAWWQASLAASSEQVLVALVATLQSDGAAPPSAQVHAVTLPPPSWRWLARPHLVQARLHRLCVRLDPARRAALACTLAERTGARLGQVQSVQLDAGLREEAPAAGWLLA